MAEIHLLEKRVYELIAAGEVIERPSSVIKELLENAIDAGSTAITVEIKNGGRTYMRVTDNGSGIAHEDIPVAFLRHATSKIRRKDDLSAITTLGFRGEALASICAVSRVDMITKRPEDDLGIHYRIEGGEETCYEDSGCPNGTTITVRDLFYNVPARLKFLKKDVSEGNAIANVVSKIALSHPEISFKFIRDNRSELVTSGDGKLMSAIYAVFGKEFSGSLIPVDYTLNGVSVRGYVTKPLMSKANRSFQNFFVNSRYVKSVTCMVSLEEAYRNRIMTGKFPACVLMITLDPANIDVNVHPAKIEIRFSDEKPVYDAVYFAVKNAMMTFDSPMEASIDVPEQPAKKSLTLEDIYGKPEEKPADQLRFASGPTASFDHKPPKPYDPLFAKTLIFDKDGNFTYENESPISPSSQKSYKTEPAPAKISYKYITDTKQTELCVEQPEVKKDDGPPITLCGEVFKTYIIVQRDDEMFLIDKHAAHERYNFDTLKRGVTGADIQTVLNPFEVTLSYDGHAAAAENIKLLRRFGFLLDILDAPQVLVCGVPILLTDEDPADLLMKIADSLALGKKSGGAEIYDDLYHSIACKASIKANSFTTDEELAYLAKLVIDDEIQYCPHGRPAVIKFTKREIEKLFKRIV